MGEPNLSEEKIIKDLYRDVFNYQEKWRGIVMNDPRWEAMLEESNVLSDKYKQYNKSIWKLCTYMLSGVITFQEFKQKGE